MPLYNAIRIIIYSVNEKSLKLYFDDTWKEFSRLVVNERESYEQFYPYDMDDGVFGAFANRALCVMIRRR